MLCGSAFKNKGMQPLLDAVVDYLPSPVDVPPIEGIGLDSDEHDRRAVPADDAPFSALAFKIMSDPFVGSLTFVRIYSGMLEPAPRAEPLEGRARADRAHAADAREQARGRQGSRAGDIVALVGLKDTTTGDTLCDTAQPIVLERIEFPEPVIEIAVEPKTKADQEKMGSRSQRLAHEDPSFRVSRRPREPARPSSRAWASCTSRSSSTA